MASQAAVSYSLGVSILVEIADQADVSVEGVVRVLTREPVSDAIKERVLAVLDDLTPEQTRAVQRFALAALHDVLLRPGEDVDAADISVARDQLALPLPSEESARVPALGSDVALVQLSSVLGELAEAVRDLRRETDAERRERVDDLAVLIDLITTGWQGLDARLGRIERQVGRLEPARREPPPAQRRPAPAAVEAAPALVVPGEPDLPPAAEPRQRDRLPVVAALTLVTVAIGTLAVLQLASGGPDLSRLVSGRESTSAEESQTQPDSVTSAESPGPPAATSAGTGTATTESPPPTTRPQSQATTSGVLGTTARRTRLRPPSAPAASSTTSAPPTSAVSSPGFQPTRNWAWAPIDGADYYLVEFSRAGRIFYRATPSAARLTLPDSLRFRPGSYRWVVRPGFGKPGAKALGEPVVDSPFTI